MIPIESEADYRKLAEWIVSTCLMFGATIETAYLVAGEFIRGLKSENDDVAD